MPILRRSCTVWLCEVGVDPTIKTAVTMEISDIIQNRLVFGLPLLKNELSFLSDGLDVELSIELQSWGRQSCESPDAAVSERNSS